ncbi:hypothetical protein PAALTS15_05818 [Paenibacillus alvei TS-15]|uniref:5-bromo-4-chloroindolyl phosphate hydrolysis protein n=1 Tax=Paenibacillus alvei TS-15 TaxID=1117108 RepID=S9SU59_PAEAL|nr:hypothetical protein [Paenibacillus alvei]EPY08219.1 hypothetical protein PAALTS15_05818 [Paenibacillus alvei TS-15]
MFRWTSHNWKWIVSVLVVVAVVGWIIGDWKWFLGVLIPACISVAGWIYVSWSNKEHTKEEKKIIIKIESFNNIKDPLLEVSRAYSKLGGYVFRVTRDLSTINSDEGIYYEETIKDYELSLLKKLLEEASEKFLEFVRVWEQHELLLKPLVLQRHALQSEHNELILNIRELHIDYYAWLYTLTEYQQLNIEKVPVLQKKFENTYAKLTDFSGCLLDVNFNIQNYAFSELLKDELDKRKVSDEKYLTIDTLIKKHNSES